MTDPDQDMLRVDRDAGIVTVTLNRPDQMNAISTEMHRALEILFRDLARDDTVRAVVLTGAGRAFSAGGDLKKMLERIETPEIRFREAARIPAMAKGLLASLLELPHPLIGAINGDAIGLGATVALACDITVMSETAKIGDPHVKIGMVAGDGGAALWPALIGPHKAKEYLMRGLIVSGQEAAGMGLVNHAVPADAVAAEAEKLAAELAALPPLALRWTKQSVNRSILAEFHRIMDTSILSETLTILSADYAEAVRAMAERRKPEYRGE